MIEVALDLIEKQGIEGTSMEQIADEAGIGSGTLYHHFPDKRALLLRLMEAWGERIEGDGRSDVPLKEFLNENPRAALAGVLRNYYERLHNRSDRYTELALLLSSDSEVRKRTERLKHAGAERFAAIIEFGQMQGRLRDELDPAIAAFLVINAMELVTTQVIKRMRPKEETERFLEELTEMLCRYLLKEP